MSYFLFLLFLSVAGTLDANSITISGSPAPLSITTAVAGSAPTAVQDTSTTYGVTTTQSNRTVLGKISSNMPTGVTLSVQLEAPSGATSNGLVSMNTTNKNLVRFIPKGTSTTGLQITYQLSATSRAVPASNVKRTLTLTIQ